MTVDPAHAAEIVVALAGGALIGLGAALLLLSNGRMAGISGIVAGLLRPAPGDWEWRVAFILGLVAGGAVFAVLRPAAFPPARGSFALLVL
ncbi:MAG: YeeE/YedE family protein, partial [Deltaproteobacteria bacterium]|nr:YeeE/YedE family protein [Deltaproteobacteria bacterium]